MNLKSLLLVFVIILSDHAFAGGAPVPVQDPGELERRAKFSKLIEQELAAKRVNLAIVGRLGRPQEQLPQGVKFTHVGIAVYSTISAADGVSYPAYVFYNLYQSSEKQSRSKLVVDSAYQFFAQTSAVKAGVIIPTLELQKMLLHLLTSENYAALHRQPYSVISNPLTLGFQNCTEFVADLITAAIYDTDNPLQIKANQRAYFAPVRLQISKTKVTLASIFSSGISMSDHDGPIQIATFQSIANYLERHAALKEVFVLCENSGNC